MMQRMHGQVTFECDSCGDVLDTDEKNFDQALQTMREMGWRAHKVGDDWMHRCDSCSLDAA